VSFRPYAHFERGHGIHAACTAHRLGAVAVGQQFGDAARQIDLASSLAVTWIQARWYVFHRHHLPLTILFVGHAGGYGLLTAYRRLAGAADARGAALGLAVVDLVNQVLISVNHRVQ
jgi:hypothetical protein